MEWREKKNEYKEGFNRLRNWIKNWLRTQLTFHCWYIMHSIFIEISKKLYRMLHRLNLYLSLKHVYFDHLILITYFFSSIAVEKLELNFQLRPEIYAVDVFSLGRILRYAKAEPSSVIHTKLMIQYSYALKRNKNDWKRTKMMRKSPMLFHIPISINMMRESMK